MRGYGQFCPVAKGAEIFAERWTPLVLRELLLGSTRFGDLHRGIPLMSRSLLSLLRKQLEEMAIVQRNQGLQGPEYDLTEAGKEFAPIIQQLGQWGQRWYRTKFGRDELDVRALMWDMRRRVNPDAFPAKRISVQFEFSDQPASKRSWWLISDCDEVDLCPTDPGFEVGLYVATDLRTMTRVWMGELSLPSAVSSGAIELTGSRDLRQRFERWIALSAFAGIEDARRPPARASDHGRSERRLGSVHPA